MIAFPGMLIPAAESAGMKVPPNPEEFKAENFPHFQVFCNVQLGAPMPYPVAVWDNAKVIASVSDAKITKITHKELKKLGLAIGFPIP
jgi:hypothetical protein